MRAVRGVLGAGVAMLLGGSLLIGGPLSMARADDAAFTITDKRITQSSGLAADAAAQVYWTVNDDAPGEVYALGEDGAVKAVISYGADITDVEAVARGRDRLYVGDIGDNKRKRSMITVYSFLNPQARTATLQYRAWDFTYPDGKAHDAEALLVDANGQIYIVTKAAKGAIYTFKGAPSSQGTNKLSKVADAPPYVTDGTFLPDGRMALRTYVGVYVLDKKQDVVAEAGIPFQQQGESMTTSLADANSLLIGSEGADQPVLSVPIPAGRADVPTASAPPESDASGEATPAADDEGSGDNSGTFQALGIALAVALAAALVTALLGRRRSRRAADGDDDPDGDRDSDDPDSDGPDPEDAGAGPADVSDEPQEKTGRDGGSTGDRPTRGAENATDRKRRADLDWLYEERG